MKNIILIFLILFSTTVYAQQMGAGLNIQVHSESDITESGGSELEVKEETLIFGGSFHYFQNQIREYEVDAFAGRNKSDNGVSETNQIFWGLGGGVNFHILETKLISSGLGARLSFENYLEPDRDPDADYDSYVKFNTALEMPVFLDVKMHEHFLIRFSVVAAGLIFDYHSQKIEGVKESQYNLDLYTTATSNSKISDRFPFSIYFIYKF